MVKFDYNGASYSYYYSQEFKPRTQLPQFKEYRDSGYIDMGAAFDIETTSFYSEKYRKAIANMWHWQFGLFDCTYTGRTWREFVDFLEKVNAEAEKANAKLLVLVQNFSFEWQFLKGILDWNIDEKTGFPDIFAKSDREVIYARWRNIEFRDTLALTAMGLGKYQKNFGTKVGKLVGDLDYTLYRHYMTKVTDAEMAYNINDVQILTDFFNVYLKPAFLDKGERIPLTSTGIVRADIKRCFDEMSPKDKKYWRNKIRRCMPSRDLYIAIRQYAFRGGLVHANTSACNDLIEDSVRGRDLKSAHPSHMLQDLMPYRYTRKNKSIWKKIVAQSKERVDYGFLGVFRFYNIRAKQWHCLESKNKIIDSSKKKKYTKSGEFTGWTSNARFENGRLASCFSKDPESPGWIEVMLTDIDWLNYEDLYTWEDVSCSLIYECKKEPLPDYVRKMVCKYFDIKENTPKDTLEYNLAKRKLNSCFGMAATGLVEEEMRYDSKTKKFVNTGQFNSYESLTKNLIMLPMWAVEIAALTRRDIVTALDSVGLDAYYYDTDSVKYVHPEKHEQFFEEFNKRKMEINRNMNVYDYDPKIFEKLGCFEWEYDTDKGGFKTLGAKRYLAKIDGKIHVTVAGMVKGSLEEYCEQNELDIWHEFKNNLTLSSCYSKKTTTVYTDETVDDILEDYEGHIAPIHEESCVAIVPIPFKMSVDLEFIQQIIEKKKERKNMIYKGVL